MIFLNLNKEINSHPNQNNKTNPPIVFNFLIQNPHPLVLAPEVLLENPSKIHSQINPNQKILISNKPMDKEM